MNLHVNSVLANDSAKRSRQFRDRIDAVHAYKFVKGIDPAPYWSGMWMWDLIEMAPKRTRTSIGRIISLVCETYNFSEAELLSPGHRSDLVRARHIACYLARKCTAHSFPMLGRHFSRDHTTILHAFEKISKKMAADPVFAVEINGLMKRLS